MKRLTIELDDAPDQGRQTSAPSQEGVGEQGFKARQLTGLPTESYEAETTGANPGRVVPRAPGRTFPDLAAEFMTNSQVMATILTTIPFMIFAGSVKEIADLLYPAITGGLLNFVWFGTAWFNRKRKK